MINKLIIIPQIHHDSQLKLTSYNANNASRDSEPQLANFITIDQTRPTLVLPLYCGTGPREPTAIPAVEGAALGRDAVVDLRGRVESELDAAAPKAAEDVADDVELEEAVQEDRHDGDGGERVALRGHHRRRAEQQLGGRLAPGDGLRVQHPALRRGGGEATPALRSAIWEQRSAQCGGRTAHPPALVSVVEPSSRL
jgi:hypothetical protein